MKPNFKNPYGYKINGKYKGNINTYFYTYNYYQAKLAKSYFTRFGPVKKRPTYEINPITKKEYRDNIWLNIPF